MKSHRAVKNESGQDEIGSSPVEGSEHSTGHGGENEGAESWSAHGDSGSQGTSFLEVVAHGDDGWQVDKTEADTTAYAVGDEQHRHRAGVGAGNEGQTAEDAAHNTRGTASELVC